jgi:hypothetical protein
VLDAWHHPLSNIAGPLMKFTDYRVARGINQRWAHLMQLQEQAEKYACRCPGLTHGDSPGHPRAAVVGANAHGRP